jgi:hypothetical protein
LNGNLAATGTASGGTTTDVISWQGKLSVSGNSLSTQGTLSGPYMSGIFSGTGISSYLSGTFSVTIDANGVIQGSFNGTYSGIIAGQVDLNGNLAATGTASGGTTPIVISWQGKLSVSGNSLSIQGNLSGPYMSGIFSGTGIASH